MGNFVCCLDKRDYKDASMLPSEDDYKDLIVANKHFLASSKHSDIEQSSNNHTG